MSPNASGPRFIKHSTTLCNPDQNQAHVSSSEKIDPTQELQEEVQNPHTAPLFSY